MLQVCAPAGTDSVLLGGALAGSQSISFHLVVPQLLQHTRNQEEQGSGSFPCTKAHVHICAATFFPAASTCPACGDIHGDRIGGASLHIILCLGMENSVCCVLLSSTSCFEIGVGFCYRNATCTGDFFCSWRASAQKFIYAGTAGKLASNYIFKHLRISSIWYLVTSYLSLWLEIKAQGGRGPSQKNRIQTNLLKKQCGTHMASLK